VSGRRPKKEKKEEEEEKKRKNLLPFLRMVEHITPVIESRASPYDRQR
jgi:hypothetical protein